MSVAADLEAVTPAQPAPPRLSLDIFQELHQSQMGNGLRQRNFIRYRAYCSRRLRRLRKSVRFLHGKGKFIQKKMELEHVQHVRHLLILLNYCERAWAHAMEIKLDVVDENSRSRFHMRRRLAKAKKWAEHFVYICQHTADTLTHLQAECYCSWMSGNYYLEKEKLGKALTAFSHSLKVSEKLLEIADTPQQREIYQSRIQSLQPSIRFCQYKTKQDAMGSSDLASVDDLDVVLSSKLAAARQERDSQIIASAVDHVTWKGRQIPIKSDSVKNAIAKAVDMKSTINDSSPQNAILACFDALDIARSAVANAIKSPDVTESDKFTLKSLLDFVSFNKLQVTLQRNMNLFNQLSNQIDQGSRTTTFDDLIVMCEKILANVNSLDEPNPEILSRFTAHRYYYMGKKLAGQSEWDGATYFFEKSVASYSQSDERYIARARQASIIARLSTRSESDQEQIDTTATGLLQRLQQWSEAPGLVMELPPSFACTGCKPVQFDLAASGLVYPSVDSKLSRRTSTATGWLSRLWG